MGPEQQRLGAADRVNLVAYLDGELGEADAQSIATKLTQCPSARREIEALQKTWELLDYLPRPRASTEFTARTVSLAAAAAPLDERFARMAGHAVRQALRVLASLLVALAAFALAFAATRWVWPDPTARLARDLPLAEHLDEYREVGSFEFLKELEELPDFHEAAK